MTEPTEPFSTGHDIAAQLDLFDEDITDLREMFEDALRALENVDDINVVLAHSERPDLVLEAPAQVMPLNRLEDTTFNNLNNFIPQFLMTAKKAGASTLQEWGAFFEQWGAKGAPEDYIAIGQQQGDAMRAIEILMHTQMLKPALTRMWILFPELTQMVLDGMRSRDTSNLRDGNDISAIREDFFVAYNVMARLIDEGDPMVLTQDETGDAVVDQHYLWH